MALSQRRLDMATKIDRIVKDKVFFNNENIQINEITPLQSQDISTDTLMSQNDMFFTEFDEDIPFFPTEEETEFSSEEIDFNFFNPNRPKPKRKLKVSEGVGLAIGAIGLIAGGVGLFKKLKGKKKQSPKDTLMSPKDTILTALLSGKTNEELQRLVKQPEGKSREVMIEEIKFTLGNRRLSLSNDN